jgi:hypothetical protein
MSATGVSRQVGLEGISQHEFESSFLRVADNTLGVTGHIHESGRDTASWREGCSTMTPLTEKVRLPRATTPSASSRKGHHLVLDCVLWPYCWQP